MKHSLFFISLVVLTLTGCASNPDPQTEARNERQELYREMLADSEADEVADDNEFAPSRKSRSAELSVDEEIEDELLR